MYVKYIPGSHDRGIVRGRRYFGDEMGCKLTETEIEKICLYLINPTCSGIWQSESKMHFNRGIFRHIKSEIKDVFKDKDYLTIQFGRRKRRIKKTEIEEAIDDGELDKVTTILRIFSYIHFNETENTSKLNELEEQLSHEETIIIELIDLDKIKAKFEDAYEYYKNEIFFTSIGFIVPLNGIFRSKSGFIISNRRLHGDYKNYAKVVDYGIEKDSLIKFYTFLEKLGIISQLTIQPIFSPEEEVFTPYFTLLEQSYSSFIDLPSFLNLFRKVISEYTERDYSHCIGTIGIIAEDFLIQVYETYFREVAMKSYTLGQRFDNINSRIQKQFTPEKKEPKTADIKPIYGKINKATSNIDSSDVKKLLRESLIISRDTLNYVKSENNKTKCLIESLNTVVPQIFVFPKYVRDNINELIKYRNAISHKSRIPIGNYEAIRTVYCCVTLILWWKDEKKSIDWDDDPDDILKKSIERNCGIKIG